MCVCVNTCVYACVCVCACVCMCVCVYNHLLALSLLDIAFIPVMSNLEPWFSSIKWENYKIKNKDKIQLYPAVNNQLIIV